MIPDQSTTVTFYLEMFNLLKLIRVTRLTRLINYLNLRSSVKMMLRLSLLFSFLILYLHLVCCAWFYIARQEQAWIPPLDVSGTDDFYSAPPLSQYFTSMYYTVLMLAGNDMMPQGDIEITFATIFSLCASIVNATIFGNIAVILQQMNRKQASFHEKVENATSTMRNMSIPENIQNSVLSYLISTQQTLDQQQEFDNFLKLLSPSLRFEVTKYIFSGKYFWKSNFWEENWCYWPIFIWSFNCILLTWRWDMKTRNNRNASLFSRKRRLRSTNYGRK